jgi:hypothetical protein
MKENSNAVHHHLVSVVFVSGVRIQIRLHQVSKMWQLQHC